MNAKIERYLESKNTFIGHLTRAKAVDWNPIVKYQINKDMQIPKRLSDALIESQGNLINVAKCLSPEGLINLLIESTGKNMPHKKDLSERIKTHLEETLSLIEPNPAITPLFSTL